MENNLSQARQEINELNQQLVVLLEKRFARVKEVNDFKLSRGLPVLDQQREKQILDQIAQQVTIPELAVNIQAIFREIMHQSRIYEEEQRNGGKEK